MNMTTKPLSELVEELSPASQRIVRDFVEFLLTKEPQKKNRKLNQIRLKRRDELQNFVEALFANGAVNLISLEPTDTQRLLQVAKSYKLDFDDAYQYVAAEKFEAELVSFDSDFDRTERGRVTPVMIIERFE